MLGAGSIHETELTNHLQRIVSSKAFTRSKRLVKFLNYVVWRSYRERPQYIRAYEIAIDAFDRGQEFDPEDPYIRNIAKLTRKALKKYYTTPDPEDHFRIDLPAGNFVITFTRLDNDDRQEPKQRTLSPQRLQAYSSSAYSFNQPESVISTLHSEKPLLGIIPFSNLANRENDDWLGELIAGELIACLAPSNLINVVSRLSTTHFKDPVLSKTFVLNQLKTDYLLTGSCQRHSHELVLTIELATRQKNNTLVLWTENFTASENLPPTRDRVLINAILEKICTSIERNEIQLVNDHPLETININRLIFCASNYMHCGPTKLFNTSKDLLLTALTKSPHHPTANALLAQWYIFRINRGGGWSNRSDSLYKAKAWHYCDKALERWPSHALALTTYGLLQTQLEKKPEKALEYFFTAEKFNPNEPLTQAYKTAVHAYLDEGKKAVEAAELALRLSPFDPQIQMFETALSAAYLADNRLDDAEIHAKNAYRMNSNHTSNLRGLISVLVEQGKISEAKGFANKLLSIDPEFNIGIYLSHSPNAQFRVGQRIAKSLELAGIPRY